MDEDLEFLWWGIIFVDYFIRLAIVKIIIELDFFFRNFFICY